METLLNYDKDVLETRIKFDGYEVDTAADMKLTDPPGDLSLEKDFATTHELCP